MIMSNIGPQMQSSLQSFWISHKDMFDKNLQAALALYQLIKGMATVAISAGTSIAKLNELKNNNLGGDLENAKNAYRENIENYPGWSLYKGFYGMVFTFNTIKALTKPLSLGDNAYQKGTSAFKALEKIPELFNNFSTKALEAGYATFDRINLDTQYIYSEMQKAIYEQGHSFADEGIKEDLSSCHADSSFYDPQLCIIGRDSLAAGA